RTRYVKINGTIFATLNQVSGNWSASVTLQPGINHILVQGLDVGSQEYARVAFDLFYDNGSVTIYTAAGSPYTVSANLTIGNNAALIIQPGATVYVNAGVTIQATGTGRIVAEGTAGQHIHITKNPSQGNW